MNRSTLLWIAVAALPCTAADPSSTAPVTTTTMDPGLRRAFEQVLYKWQPSESGTFRGCNPAQRLRAKFDSHGVQLQDGSAKVQFRLNRFGYSENSRTPVEAEPTLNGKRLEYGRGEITEWYENDSPGIEQGFTIWQRPGKPRGGEPLTIELSVDDDWQLTLAQSGNSVLLKSSTGAVLRYGGLRSWDARLQPVPAHLEASGREIRLVIDDAYAEYPLVVDPVFTQQAELTPPAFGIDQFGSSVAVSGNTAVVGARNDNVAYVYTLNGTWTLQQKLTAADGAAGDNFGYSAAISGNTILVGAPNHTVGSNANQGAVYLFANSNGSWTQQAELTSSDGAAGDSFGVSVAFDGNTAVVGADNANGKIGAAYVFTGNNGAWAQQARLTPGDGVSGDGFGGSVAVSGSLAAIGASNHPATSANNPGPGAVYLYVNNGGLWTERTEVTEPQGVAGDYFGGSVALNASTLVVGTPGGLNEFRGAVYIFDTFGNEETKIQAFDEGPFEQFGWSVALNGNLVVIGAYNATIGSNGEQGAVYLYNLTVGSQQKLIASDGGQNDLFGESVAASGNVIFVGATDKNGGVGAAYVFDDAGVEDQELTISRGEAYINFGSSVSISGNTALIGGPEANDSNGVVGAAFVFVQNNGTWTLQQALTASDGQPGDEFGTSVAIDGNTAVIGAPLHSIGADSLASQGAAYVFVRNGEIWSQQAKLLASDAQDFANFGISVSISGNTAIIGASSQSYPAPSGDGDSSGVAYVFVNNGSTWTQQTELMPADGAMNEPFGISISIDGNTALIGAEGIPPVSGDGLAFPGAAGAAYVFVFNGATWSQQTELTASDGVQGDEFGASVALSGNNAVIGAPNKTIGSNASEGAAYVFTGLGGSVSQTRLTPADGMANAYFGSAVALNGNTIVLGRSQAGCFLCDNGTVRHTYTASPH